MERLSARISGATQQVKRAIDASLKVGPEHC